MDTKGHEWPSFSPIIQRYITYNSLEINELLFGTFEGLRKTGNSHFFDKTLIFDSNLDKTLTFTPLPA